jgi:hypothetical protein
MFRAVTLLIATLLIGGSLVSASAQSAAPPEKPAKMKLARQSLKDMRAKWSANKGKLAVCRKEVRAKGLAGDDRWFYIEECMGKS